MLNKLASDTSVAITPKGAAVNVSNWTLGGLVGWAIGAVLGIAGIIFFFMLLLGGIQWLTSGGDKQSTEQARGRITAALIGLIIIFGAWAIVTLVGTVFNVDLLNFDLGTIGS